MDSNLENIKNPSLKEIEESKRRDGNLSSLSTDKILKESEVGYGNSQNKDLLEAVEHRGKILTDNKSIIDVINEKSKQLLNRNNKEEIKIEALKETSDLHIQDYVNNPFSDRYAINSIWIEEMKDKTDLIVIERIRPKAGTFRDFTIASVFNPQELAERFHEALGPEKSAEGIDRELWSLRHEKKAIQMFKIAYQEKYGESVENVLEGRFGKGTPQLKHALGYIDAREAEIMQVIEPSSSGSDEVSAKCIKEALQSKQYERIYEELDDHNRNAESLARLDSAYRKLDEQLGTGLQADLEKNLEGDSLKYAQFLIGHQAMEREVMSQDEAIRWWPALSGMKFDKGDSVGIPVPDDWLLTGCEYRAYLRNQALKEAGYKSENKYAVSVRSSEYGWKQPDLHIRSHLAPETMGVKDQTISCYYHAVSCIQVQTKSGPKEFVLDRSLFPYPLTIEEWMVDKLGKPSYKPINFEEFRSKTELEYQEKPDLLPNPNHLPADQTYLLTTNRNYSEIPTLDVIKRASKFTAIPDQYSAIEYREKGKEMLKANAEGIPYVRMANSLRWERQDLLHIQSDQDAQAFLDKITQEFQTNRIEFQSTITDSFKNAFLEEAEEFLKHLEHVSPSMVAPFEEQFTLAYGSQEQVVEDEL